MDRKRPQWMSRERLRQSVEVVLKWSEIKLGVQILHWPDYLVDISDYMVEMCPEVL